VTAAGARRSAGTAGLLLAVGLLVLASWLVMGRGRDGRPAPPAPDTRLAVAATEPERGSESGPESEPGPGSESESEPEPEPEPEPGPEPTGMAKLRVDFEAGVRDAGAIEDEKLVRAIYEHHQGDLGILRGVRCQGSVCRIRARWSQETTGPYNEALVEVVHELSREVNLEPDGPPDGLIVPMAIYVRRAGPAAGD
jgi:hypothetical protein